MNPRVDSDPVANTGSRPISAKSSLPLHYQLGGTYRFGELGVCFVQDTVPDDETPFGSRHNLRSYQMRAPLLSEAKIKKDYIEVPMPALLPINYEKFITQPQVGEDVVPENVGLFVPNLTSLLYAQIKKIDPMSLLQSEFGVNISQGILTCVAAQRIYSKGSLLAALGEPLHPLWKNFDKFFDLLCNKFASRLSAFYSSTEGEPLMVVIGKNDDDDNIYSGVTPENFRDFVVWSFDHYWWFDDSAYEEYGEFEAYGTEYQAFLQGFASDMADIVESEFCPVYPLAIEKGLSLQRVASYQLACAEFFTNSHVDDVYSAEPWRQNYSSFLHDSDIGLGLSFDTFSYNGVATQYDALSSYYTQKVLSADGINGDPRLFFEWTRLIFGFNRSLRYQDYFVASRTRPLAVGDVNVEVNNGYVNIVDTIEKRWYAKFLNQVNRAQRKLSDYSRALFPNLTMQRDFHNPLWLAGTSDIIDAPEIQNTGAGQLSEEVANSTTAVLRSSGGKYAFEYHSQYYGVIIGIEWFDIKRFYSGAIERPNFFIDRNDYFNPFLQFVGDQPIFKDELYASLPHSEYLGYTGRYNEYKYRTDQAFGGLIENLPGWIFLSDERVFSRRFRYDFHQSSDFIRSWTPELDEFFPALSGYSLATYYHFIVVNTNNADNTRPMVANPQLD